MLAKGVIRDIVAWKSCRSYFYWRLKRRFEELRLADALTESGRAESYSAAMRQLQKVISMHTSDKDAYERLAPLQPSAL